MRRYASALLGALLGLGLLAPVSRATPRSTPDPAEQAKLVACSNTAGNAKRPRFCTAQTLDVENSTGELGHLTRGLEVGLGLGEGTLTVDESDGAIRYLDGERFQSVPTRTIAENLPALVTGEEDGFDTSKQVLDVPALLNLGVFAPADAVAKLSGALSAVGLLPEGVEPVVGHSTIELVENPDAVGALPLPPGLDRPIRIDTSVTYPLSIGEPPVPVIGPGAKIKASFDGEGNVTQLLYSAVQYERGGSVAIVPPEQGPALCAQTVDAPADVTVSAQFVYHALPLAAGASRLLPHFRCGFAADGVESREVLVPAVLNAPKVTVATQAVRLPDGATQVTAQADVTGGTPGYTFHWSSANATLPDGPQGNRITYTVDPRADAAGALAEELLVTVADADGLTGIGRADLTVTAPTVLLSAAAVAADAAPSGIDVATEWVGTFNHAGDLPGVSPNAAGFRTVNRDEGYPVRFDWGNNDAFEVDFKDEALGGNDNGWVDATDMLFYSGHANGDGWVLESNEDDQFVDYTDTQLGNTDLEWLVLGACGTLQENNSDGTWAESWGPTFRGLHMILGYASISQDTSQEGRRFAEYMHGLRDGGVRKLYQAWGQQAIDLQPATDSRGRAIRYAYGGPVGPNYEWNAHDYMWGRGSVSSDVANPWYFWVTRGQA